MRLLVIAVIACVGWAAITALNIAAMLYLRRFQLDTEDNLLARKHNTQVRILLRTVDVVIVISDDRGRADDLRGGAPIRRQPVRLGRRRRPGRRSRGAAGSHATCSPASSSR